MYIKMPKNLSAKYDQIKKEYKKMLLKNTKIFLKKRKKPTMVVYVTKISEKMKNQYINYRKKYYRMLKTLYYNHKKLLFKKKKT